MIDALEALLAGGRDSPELRFGLGKAWLEAGDCDKAVLHLTECLRQKATYSAGWKWLGKAYEKAGKPKEALEAWERGMQVAAEQGDKQAEKEMQVFARRIKKSMDG